MSIAVAVIAVVALPASGQFSMARPNFGVPEFAQTGGTFRVEIKATSGLSAGRWSAVLLNDLRSWTGTVEQAEYGTYVDNNTVAGYRLTVRLPAGVSPEVFMLAVSHPDGGAATNRNAVSVLSCIETNFYIFHYADPQAEAYEPNSWDSGMYGTHGSVRELLWHAPSVRLANPRFMFDTGDELDNAYGTSVARYEQYKDGMCGMGVAVLATRGNNDNAVSTANWRSTIGVETYSLAMGSFHIYQKDVRENTYTTLFTNDYVASFTNTAVKYRLFGQHFINNTDGKCPYFWLPSAGQYPDLMLVGHGHSNSKLQTSPYYIIESQQACNKGAVGFLQFEKSGGNWSCTTLASPWFQMMSAGPTSKLTCAYAYVNDGSQTTNTASITNTLAFRFWDGRVRFLLKYSALGYQVTNGEKLAEYAYCGGSNVAVLVKVNIAPSATTTVSVSRVDADEDGMADSWEMVNFGSLTTAATTTDYDDDGVLDWQEYVAGTQPTNGQSFLTITNAVITGEGNRLVLSWPSASERVYCVLGTTDLVEGITNVVQSCLAPTPPANTYTVDVAAAGRTNFFRVSVETR